MQKDSENGFIALVSSSYEWWFKDAINDKEMKLKKQYGITQKMIDFYDGRLYQKKVDKPTTHNDWIKII